MFTNKVSLEKENQHPNLGNSKDDFSVLVVRLNLPIKAWIIFVIVFVITIWISAVLF